MFPLLSFIAGLVTGAVAVRALRSAAAGERLDKVQEQARAGLETTRSKLRDAAVAGLTAVESSSAAMKQRLIAAPAGEVPGEDAVAAQDGVAQKAPPDAP